MSDQKIIADTAPQGAAKLTDEEVHGVVGDIVDSKVAAIVATGATLDDLESAAAWAAGESDVMGNARHKASATIAAVYDILTTDEVLEEERG